MLSEKMEKALNEQVAFEIYSGYIYMAMSAWASEEGLDGAANWFRLQNGEELYHADKMYKYIIERGGRAKLMKIDEPPFEWKSVLAAFEHALEHERIVTGRINDLMYLAMQEKDFASTSFLQWYVDEQVEEESSVGEVINKLKLVDGKGHGMLMIDRDLASRTFVWPSNTKE